ncbi:MAG: hypothetical protein R6X09_09700 [Bacteroidales bacterium]
MRSILLFAAVFFTCIMTNAQNYTRDAGVRIGDYISASCRQFSSEDEALEGILFIGRQGFTFSIMKEHFEPALGNISDNLFVQYGYGAHIGLRRTDHYQVLNRTYRLEDETITPLLGVDGLIGIEYRFPEFPFLIGFDFKPYFEFSTIQVFSIYLQSFGMSIKYRF